MTQLLRRTAFGVLITLPVLAGCVSDGCDQLVYEEGRIPQATQPLVIPEGVAAPVESGKFSMPRTATTTEVGGCKARPPMTLPEEVLKEPEEETGEATAEDDADANGSSSP